MIARSRAAARAQGGFAGDDTPGPGGAVGVSLYDAFSRGELRLASADPDAGPVVDENMLAA